MASRVGGTVLALTAASLLAVTLATGSWWSGHPDINGQTISAKSVHIGMLVAEGCNTGGDGACKALELGGAFDVTRYAVAGAGALTMLGLVGIALLTLKRSERRKLFAGIAFVGAVLGMLAAIALLVQGPDLKTNAKVAVPLGWGLYVFGGAIFATIGSGLVALRPLPPPPRPVLAPQGWSGQPPPPEAPPPGVDMAALMQESALRPSEPAPRPPMPPSPGGILPGPSGPLGVAPAPLFSSAPQLRPLYEAAPPHGGTSGFQPQPPPPPLAMRAPTPVPRAQVSAKHGIPTPPPLEVPPSSPPSAAPRPDGLGAIRAIERPKSKSLPPPVRGKPLTAPPPLPTANPPRPASTTRPPPPKPTFTAPAAIPPKPFLPPLPARQMTEDLTIDREKERAFDVAPTRAHVKEDPDFDAAETSLPDELATQAQPSLGVGDSTDVNAGFAESTSPAASAFESTSEREIDEALERDRLEAAKRAATDTDAAPLVKPPISTAPDSLPPPKEKEVATSGPSPACPQCEAPMAWVEAHLRFYCKSCKMYF